MKQGEIGPQAAALGVPGQLVQKKRRQIPARDPAFSGEPLRLLHHPLEIGVRHGVRLRNGLGGHDGGREPQLLPPGPAVRRSIRASISP